MANFRYRTKGKGKRWKKGHSSSSNPESKRHRNVAKSRFFQEHPGEGNLTSEALKKHDALLGAGRSSSEQSQDGDGDATFGGTFKTFQTFASDWSECSNVSFNKLLKGFCPSSALHKEMLAVLAAVTEVIKTSGGKETTVEYLGALMTTLDVCESEESVTAVIMLLGMGIKKVPSEILQLKYSEMAKTFLNYLGKFAESDNTALLRSLIGCLSVLLQVQEVAVWSNPSTLQVFDTILTFTTHSKPKVRKAAQHAVCAILKGSSLLTTGGAPEHHPAASHVAKYLIQEIESGASTTTLHSLGLLKEVLATFPKPQLKASCESVLKVMTLGNVLVTSCGMQSLYGLFVSRPSSLSLPPQLNAQLITALFDYQPAPNDPQTTLAWLAVMQEAYINLARLDLSLCFAHLSRLFSAATRLWLSDKAEVMSAATLTLKAVTEDCVGPACSVELVKAHYQTLGKLFSMIESGLTYQYHSAWCHVLHLLAVWFQVAGATCSGFMMSCLKLMAELRDSYKFSNISELEFAVGRAIRSLGPETVLNAIPLQITGEETNYEFKRSWLLPVLRENVCSSQIKFFLSYFLPLATVCRKRSVALEDGPDNVGVHSYKLLQSQIWALLPCFCNNPTDLKDNFKVIAKVLGTAIGEYKDLRLDTMSALRKLITSSQEANNEDNVKEMARFAKNYLPILFNLYTSKPKGTDEEGQRLAAYETVKVYLQIASPQLCQELFDRALEKLNAADVDAFVRESVLDLLRALLPYQDKSRLAQLFSICQNRLSNTKNHHEQKKAYRLLEELCGSSSDSCKAFVSDILPDLEKLLLYSLSTSAAFTKGPRLRCLSHLVMRLDRSQLDVLQQIVPEAILCCKDINEKCRSAAYSLLVLIGRVMQQLEHSGEDTMREYIGLLLPGLAGSTTLISATILALARVTHEFRDSMSMDLVKMVLENVCLLMTTRTREIVGSALSFIKMFLTSFSYDTVAPEVSRMVKSIVGMTDDCKHHFRLKTRNLFDRLVRKFGFDSIVAVVPASDVITHKRLRNLRKIQAKKKNMQAKENQDEDESDPEKSFVVKAQPKSIEEILAESEESELEVDTVSEVKSKKKKDTNMWIHEDADSIVDFTDRTAAGKITATQPGGQGIVAVQKIKKKKSAFRTASDGRLIITEDSSGSEEEEYSHDLDSENEEKDEDTKSRGKPAGRKRKLSGSTDASQPAMKYQAGGLGIHRPTKRPSRHGQRNSVKPGVEYRARKAKGDVKKKGKPDPYAYLPLSRKALNKRKQKKNSGQFKSLCQAAHKGAQKGIRARKNRHKK